MNDQLEDIADKIANQMDTRVEQLERVLESMLECKLSGADSSLERCVVQSEASFATFSAKLDRMVESSQAPSPVEQVHEALLQSLEQLLSKLRRDLLEDRLNEVSHYQTSD